MFPSLSPPSGRVHSFTVLSSLPGIGSTERQGEKREGVMHNKDAG